MHLFFLIAQLYTVQQESKQTKSVDHRNLAHDCINALSAQAALAGTCRIAETIRVHAQA